MRNFAFIIVALIIGVAGGYYAWRYFNSNDFEAGAAGRSSKKVTAQNYSEPFMWGVNVNPSAVRNYSAESWNKQMNFVYDLKANWIRVPFDYTPANKYELYDEMYTLADKKDINIYLGLGSSKPILDIEDTYEDGYKVAYEVSSHYKGKIKYYQLMSEQGSTALKGATYSGENESDYDQKNYEKVREWMRGATNAIRKNDPDAYIVITDQWTHTAYIDMLIRDKIDFDIIGWDWFGDMGMMGTHKLRDGTLLVDKLKSFNKPIILAECNYRPGKYSMNDAKQADYIPKMAEWAYNSGYIRGFYVHELVDLRPNKGKPGDHYGLITYKIASDGGYTYGEKRPAFDTYRDVITKYSK